MTNEEAIVVLQKIKPIPHRGDSKSTTHILETIALDMAIKALEQQSCEDCISREATIDAIYKKYIGGKDAIKNAPINDMYADGLAEAVDAVWDMPSVTPTRPTGKWIEVFVETPNDPYSYGFKSHKCSNCEHRPLQISDYCPNCGARMEAETKIEQGLNFGDQDTMMPAT